MFLPTVAIHRNSLVNDIVRESYRTADVFRKYGIEYCCGGRWPMDTVCMAKGLDFEQLKNELEQASHTVRLPASLPFHAWSVDFLTNYIVNVHHYYLKTALPETEVILKEFTESHAREYPSLPEIYQIFLQLKKDILPHLEQEEDSIFPYLRQIANAYKNNDSYAKLLVKTLRKPIPVLSAQEDKFLTSYLHKLRELTDNYTLPEKACVSHKIMLARLKELDDDLVQHIYLENKILFPRATLIEQELLK